MADLPKMMTLGRAYPLSPPWKGGPSWQYKVWRDDIARQRGEKPPLGTREGKPTQSTRCPYTIDLLDN